MLSCFYRVECTERRRQAEAYRTFGSADLSPLVREITRRNPHQAMKSLDITKAHRLLRLKR